MIIYDLTRVDLNGLIKVSDFLLMVLSSVQDEYGVAEPKYADHPDRGPCWGGGEGGGGGGRVGAGSGSTSSRNNRVWDSTSSSDFHTLDNL